MMGHYLAANYRDESQAVRVEVIKFILFRLWVQQCIPYFLFAGNRFHVRLESADKNSFSWPMKSLLLWENYATESPLVAKEPCLITLNFFDWRLTVSRLALCAAFYSWVVDFGMDPVKLPQVFEVIPLCATALYNFGCAIGVQFYPGIATIRGDASTE